MAARAKMRLPAPAAGFLLKLDLPAAVRAKTEPPLPEHRYFGITE
jgi:hypothetical protein